MDPMVGTTMEWMNKRQVAIEGTENQVRGEMTTKTVIRFGYSVFWGVSVVFTWVLIV